MGTYEFNGEKYQKASKHQKEWGSKLMAQLQFKGSEAILDLGCGDGALTEALALSVPEGSVLGIDASAGMIQTAKQHRQDNLKFMQMDINHMDFENEFDVIYSNAALHWVKDHTLLLKKVFHALKTNGVILWNFAGDGTCSAFYETVRKIMKKDPYQEFFQGFEWPWFMPVKADYEKLIDAVGFSEVTVREENADRYFADADEMIRWIDQPSIVPFLSCVAEDKKEAFRREVVDAMVEKTLQPDGRCFETFRRINVKAVK